MSNGYLKIENWAAGRRHMAISRMVLETFLGPSRGREANHLNGVKHDNRRVNLEWCSSSENNLHSFRVLGRQPVRGEQHGRAKLTDEEVAEIRAEVSHGLSQRRVSLMFMISRSYVCRLARGDYRKVG